MTLPSEHTGGELVVHHRGESRTHRGTKYTLGLVAFHADRHHEVRPVRSGYRVTMTYNLLVEGPTKPEVTDSGENLDELAACLTEHFGTRTPKPYQPDVLDDPPSRLVYLLDHEYTERGLTWARLKGVDRERTARLAAAAERAGCVTVLALSEVQETWNAYEPDAFDRRRSYRYGVPDEDNGAADYELQDLIDSSVTLTRWVDRTDAAEDVSLYVGDAELCAGTASVDLLPYSSQYEGYMGNYGNTLDHWYRRAAVVIWPLEQDFAVRALVSPMRAVELLLTLASSGDYAQARKAATSLAPFWLRVPVPGEASQFFTATLRAAAALDDAATARILAGRFRIENLGEPQLAPLASLTQLYGENWTADLLQAWFDSRSPWLSADGGSDRTTWLTSVPQLCQTLLAADPSGTTTASRMLTLCWQSVAASLRSAMGISAPSRRAGRLAELGPALFAVLAAAGQSRMHDLVQEAVGTCQAHGDQLLACLRPALRSAARCTPEARRDGGFDYLAAQFAQILRDRLSRPARSDDDWSLPSPGGCGCELCQKLDLFLSSPTARSLDWPLAEQRRRHVHSRIEATELPVQHQTRRTGRPYTLVLTKNPSLFDDEREARSADQRDLDWHTATGWRT